MKIAITLAGKQFGVDLFESPAAPADHTDRIEKLERELAERERWESWQRNTRGGGGGQFGFTHNRSDNEIDYPHRRWEP